MGTIVGLDRGGFMPDRAETREMTIGGVKVVLDVACLAGRDRPYGLYTLRMSATFVDADQAELQDDGGEHPPARIFVYHRHANGAPADRSFPKDEFVCIADALDMDELPPDSDESEEAMATPFYRTDKLELCFRNADMMYECRDALYVMGS